jgi:hypothetical protein
MAEVSERLTKIGSAIGVLSAALGIFVTIQNQYLQRASDSQKETLDKLEFELKQQAEKRADETARRAYTITIFEKVWIALEKNDPVRQEAVLGLIATHPDDRLRSQLSRAFTGTLTNPLIFPGSP